MIYDHMDHTPEKQPNVQENAKRNIVLTGLSMLAVFFIFFLAGLHEGDSISGVSITDSKEFLLDESEITEGRIRMTSAIILDSMHPALPLKVYLNDTSSTDTTKTRIMLFGDSQVEFLRNPVYNYCLNNNCELVGSVVWYGSTTIAWGNGDSLKKYLDKFKPEFVFCALGLNEVVVPNVEPRKKYIQTIRETVKDYGAQFYWIGPAAWKPDQGITTVMHDQLGDTLFYPSHKLVLDRASDKRHPSMEASKTWFDSVAVAVTRDTHLNLSTTVSEYTKPKQSPFILIDMAK